MPLHFSFTQHGEQRFRDSWIRLLLKLARWPSGSITSDESSLAIASRKGDNRRHSGSLFPEPPIMCLLEALPPGGSIVLMAQSKTSRTKNRSEVRGRNCSLLFRGIFTGCLALK